MRRPRGGGSTAARVPRRRRAAPPVWPAFPRALAGARAPWSPRRARRRTDLADQPGRGIEAALLHWPPNAAAALSICPWIIRARAAKISGRFHFHLTFQRRAGVLSSTNPTGLQVIDHRQGPDRWSPFLPAPRRARCQACSGNGRSPPATRRRAPPARRKTANQLPANGWLVAGRWPVTGDR